MEKLKTIYRNLMHKIPKPVFSRIGGKAQDLGMMLLAAGTVGFAVAGDTVTETEAVILLVLGIAFFVCGTIVDIKATYEA